MNNSGPAVAAWCRQEGVEPGEILVLCDDLDLPLGRIRLRAGGGTGGHRGLLSLTEAFGTDSFPRLRLGLGPPTEGVDPADFVLEPWTEREKELWQEIILPWAAGAVQVAFGEGLTEAMDAFNGKPGPPGWMETGEEGGE
jgi:PTH1 family peptidyl-tRNA hydrolase